MQKVSSLIQKEMTRKEFLQTLGYGAAALFGFSAVLRLLDTKHGMQQQSFGYGGGAYGGDKKAA